MLLLTKELAKKLPPIETETNDDSKVLVHYFNPAGRGDWFGLTYDPVQQMYFGYVSLYGDWNNELGYFSLAELSEVKGPYGIGIERDIWWNDNTTLKEVKEKYTK